MKIDPIVKKILDELKFKPEDCLWEKHGATCMKHRYIEIAGQNKGVIINSLEEVEKNSEAGVVAIKCTASLGKLKVITYGEATPKNNKNSYPYAMAEKRSIDRAILKLIGVHGFIYSDDEVEEGFKNEIIKKEIPNAVWQGSKVIPKSNGSAKINIEERIKKIQSDFDNKKNSSVLERDCALLKSELNKAGRWDEFKNSDKFLAFKQLDNKITKQKQKERK